MFHQAPLHTVRQSLSVVPLIESIIFRLKSKKKGFIFITRVVRNKIVDGMWSSLVVVGGGDREKLNFIQI